MKRSPWVTGFAFLTIIVAGMCLSGCDDAQKAAYKMFSGQGLNLLRPARTYIKPGGMVFLRKGGTPEYEDPKDHVVTDDGNLMDFQASILEETSNKSTGFGAALSLATSVVPVSINAGAETNRAVTLKGIQTTGVRMTTDDLDKLIAAPNTSKLAAAELPHARVFIVQEIYKATSLDLQAQDQKTFDLKFNNGNPVANCKQSGQSGDSKSDTGKGQTSDNKSTQDMGTTNNQGTKPESKASSSGASKKANSAGSKAKNAQSGASSGAQQSSTSKLAAGVAVCIASDYTLKLQTKDPIPFAVRLAELELSNGVIQRIRGGKPLTGTLGGKEIASSLIDDNAPILANLRPKTKK